MRSLRLTIPVTLLALAVLPAAALAKPLAQPLKDQTPLGSSFKDRVITSSPRLAHAAQAANWYSYPTHDGGTVAAAISPQYGNSVSSQVAQSYVDFLDSLTHGPELSSLRIYIAPPTEVTANCGGIQGVLACYDSRTKIMNVPGEEVPAGADGVTTSYVVAHEYGHHIAAARSNAPFNSFAFGPKYWASYEMVCNRTLLGQLFPGDEGQNYGSNPGEGWAETYAQLKYPTVPWEFNPLMKPDSGAFAAAQQDVLNPWESNVSKVFSGSFGKHGSNTKRFSFDLTLDGSFAAHLYGPKKSNYNFSISSDGRSEGGTHAAGSRDSLSYQAACRQQPSETVTMVVKRVRGSGPFTLRVSYAG
jgi:hypothetical protein